MLKKICSILSKYIRKFNYIYYNLKMKLIAIQLISVVFSVNLRINQNNPANVKNFK